MHNDTVHTVGRDLIDELRVDLDDIGNHPWHIIRASCIAALVVMRSRLVVPRAEGDMQLPVGYLPRVDYTRRYRLCNDHAVFDRQPVIDGVYGERHHTSLVGGSVRPHPDNRLSLPQR